MAKAPGAKTPVAKAPGARAPGGKSSGGESAGYRRVWPQIWQISDASSVSLSAVRRGIHGLFFAVRKKLFPVILVADTKITKESNLPRVQKCPRKSPLYQVKQLVSLCNDL